MAAAATPADALAAMGRAIARRRKELRLTQAELATRAGLDQTTVSRVEAGEGSFGSCYTLAQTLGLSLADLFPQDHNSEVA